MAPPFRLTKQDGADLAFAFAAQMCGAISREELVDWVYRVIELTDPADLPSHMFDLLDALADARPEREYVLAKMLPFYPHDPALRENAFDALTGIAFVRGPAQSNTISRAGALAALKAQPWVMRRFREQFPFIDLPAFAENF
jgi:hypothetical protein